MCFCGCTSNVTRFAQGPPKGNLGMKELDRTTEPIVPTCANAITCQHGPTLQFVSCAETDSLCGTDMMAFVWMTWCLCSGKSSSQGWRKIIVVQSTDLQSDMSLHPCFQPPWFMQVCLGKPPFGTGFCRHQCFSVVAQATAKIRARPAQGLFSNERTL